MDLRRLRVGEWITAIAGVLLLVSLSLPWSDAANGSQSGWAELAVTDVLLAIVALWAIAIWIIVALAPSTGPGIASEALLVPLALVTFVVTLIKVWDHDEYGALLALVGAFGVLVGVLVAMRDERLSKDGQPTDQTGVPVDAPAAVEKLPAPPPA